MLWAEVRGCDRRIDIIKNIRSFLILDKMKDDEMDGTCSSRRRN
jgi:hypothetical protein